MTLSDQINFGAIHELADARGGKPTDQVLASVREYMRQRHLVALDRDRIGFAVSCIEGGLRDIQSGLTERGADAITDGIAFIRSKLDEAKS